MYSLVRESFNPDENAVLQLAVQSFPQAVNTKSIWYLPLRILQAQCVFPQSFPLEKNNL